MHRSSILRMQWFIDTYTADMTTPGVRVLDVGSRDTQGDSYRRLFGAPKFHYTGLDMESGPNVDVVLDAPYDWRRLATDSFDIVVSGQAFEHIEFFWITMTEMTRVLAKGGLLCLIAPNGFGEHRYPVDCYRFFTDGMVALARYVELDLLHAHTNSAPSAAHSEWYSRTLKDAMLVARKPYAGHPRHPDPLTYTCAPADHQRLRSGMVSFTRKARAIRVWNAVTRRL